MIHSSSAASSPTACNIVDACSTVTRPAYHIAECEAYMKSNEIRLGVYKVICLAVKFHGHGFGESINWFRYASDQLRRRSDFDHAMPAIL